MAKEINVSQVLTHILSRLKSLDDKNIDLIRQDITALQEEVEYLAL